MKSLKIFGTLLIAVFAMSVSSCKKEAELPPDESHIDPALKVTHTLAQFKTLGKGYAPTTGDTATQINSDVIIAGVITADDRSGNLYKTMVIEDSTGGIQVLINAYSLYATMPVGRKVYIKAKGLFLGYDGGLPVLGYAKNEQNGIEAIPASEVSNFVVKADINHAIKTDTFTLATAKNLPAAYYNRLITIKDVQFEDSSSKTWTSPNATTNRNIVDCSNTKMVVRTSNYADFAQNKLPNGKGTITGVLTVFISGSGNKTAQLIVRGEQDAQMSGLRCGQGPVGPAVFISVDSLRKKFTGSTSVLSGISIKGIVISDRANKNVNSQNMIIQDGNRGILVRFSATHSFDKGDSVEVNLDGGQLGEFSGLLEAGSVSTGYSFPVNRASLKGSGKNVTPTVVTIAQLVGANFENYESTLVTINSATLTGGPLFVNGTNGNNGITDASDGSGNLKLYTVSSATFAAQAIPTGSKNITGVVGQFNTTKQLSIRSTADIQ